MSNQETRGLRDPRRSLAHQRHPSADHKPQRSFTPNQQFPPPAFRQNHPRPRESELRLRNDPVGQRQELNNSRKPNFFLQDDQETAQNGHSALAEEVIDYNQTPTEPGRGLPASNGGGFDPKQGSETNVFQMQPAPLPGKTKDQQAKNSYG